MITVRRLLLAAMPLTIATSSLAVAQPRPQRDTALVARRDSLERELQRIAVVDRKLMVPMRDGAKMQFDVYRPKNATGPVPAIFVRTPYNMNFWDVNLGAPADMTSQIEAVRRGYAYVGANERGHFYSEGSYDILGPPLTDGVDEIQWISSQAWSNGKVGLIGCSSTAEWQMAVAAQSPKGLGTIIPQGFGAGVGRVKPYTEQGNWYRGGAVQMLFIDWLYGEQNQMRPTFPPNTSQEDLIRAAKSFDLAQRLPPVDWSKAFWHLPTKDLLKVLGGPRGIFADSMPGIATGGAMIQRTPNDPAWYRGGLFHDDMKINVPGLWFMSWYDVSVGPNLATYNHVRRTADPAIANQQYAVIAPTLHCAYKRATENTVVGERSVGDARYDYDALTYGWFDVFLKGEKNRLLDTLPKVRYYTMGMNRWQSTDSWPPRGAEGLTFYLSSEGGANTRNGNGVLTTKPPATNKPDSFSYDPMKPVMSRGGNVCCQGNALSGGAVDQQETRAAQRCARVYDRTSQGGDGAEWTDRGYDLSRVGSKGHRRDREDPRCLSGWESVQSRRDDSARPISRRLRQADVHGTGQGVQGRAATDDHEQLVRARPPHSHRSVELELPAVRSKPEYGR